MFSNLVFLFEEMGDRWMKPKTYIQIVLLLIVITFTLIFMFKLIKRKAPIICYIVVVSYMVLSYVLDMIYSFIAFALVAIILVIAFVFVNMGEIRKLIITVKPKTVTTTNANVDIKDNLVDVIVKTARTLSSQKIGAIITIERKMSLDEFIKTGTRIRADISPELIQSIFYEGTRLHDGAMIIRGNEIVAAAVFYQPSNKGLNGKYGARHRAALGISEVSDSVTIVVSEETGRVSLAYDGHIQAYKYDEFPTALKNALTGHFMTTNPTSTGEVNVDFYDE